MSYVDKNLMNGEMVVYRTKIHWIVFVRPIVAFIISIILMNMESGSQFLGAILFFMSIYWAIKSIIRVYFSEYAITNKRVLIKHGLIKRESLETLLSKIEGIHVEQSILGRLFNFGTIIINGTGGTGNPFSTLEAPLNFRKKVQEQISNSENIEQKVTTPNNAFPRGADEQGQRGLGIGQG